MKGAVHLKFCFMYVFGDLFRNKKQNATYFLTLFIAVTMIALTMISLESKKAADIYYTSELLGSFLVYGSNVSGEAAKTVLSDDSITDSEEYGYISHQYTSCGKKIAGSEDSISTIVSGLITEGSMPEKGERLICRDYYESSLNKLSVGDSYVITFQAGEDEYFTETYRISGFYSVNGDWRWRYDIDSYIINQTDYDTMSSNHTELINYTLFIFNLTENIYDFIERYASAGINLSDNSIYIVALSGTILLMPFTLIFVCVFIAGAAIIICMNQIAMKKQARNFSVLSVLGCKKESFGKTILLKAVISSLLCIPVSIAVASLLLKIIFGNNKEFFILIVSPVSVLVISALSVILIFLSTYIPLHYSRTRNISEYYAKTETKPGTKKSRFSSWYIKRFLNFEKARAVLFILATAACFASVIFLFYVYTINSNDKNMYGVDFQFWLKKGEYSTGAFSRETYEVLAGDPKVSKILKSANYYDIMSAHTCDEATETDEADIVVTLHLDEKSMFDSIKPTVYDIGNNRFIMRAELVYNDPQLLDHAKDNVVEGDMNCLWNEKGKVVVIDNTWSADDPKSFHVGDSVILEKMSYFFDETGYRAQYTPTDGNMIVLQVGAVIKDEYSAYYKNKSQFPIYVSEYDFEQITGSTAITEMSLVATNPTDISELSLLQLKINSLLEAEDFIINNQYEYNLRTHNLKTVFNAIVIMLAVAVMLSVCLIIWLFNYYYIGKRKDEFEILIKIGVPRKSLSSMLLREGIAYGFLSSVLAVVLGYMLSFAMYNAFKSNPITNPWNFPIWLLLVTIPVCFLTHIVSIMASFHLQSKPLYSISKKAK